MAFSISILILIIGFISLVTLPVEQYPDIAPPTVRVSTTYPGADAEAVMNAVIMPLEEVQHLQLLHKPHVEFHLAND